jgi:NAD(P)-dependent dehydrogenase (short-subunit alcohol dehydrogenase family)
VDEFAGKVSVVTGAGRGIGRHAALRLAELGSPVALISRSDDQLREVADKIVGNGGRALAIAADISRAESMPIVKERIERELGAPSILVNAAGVFGPIQLIRKTDPHAWIETLMVNTVGAYLTCRAFVAGMIEQGWGRIINVSSAAALSQPGPTNSAYGTSKAALNHFTRHLAAEVEGLGVTANAIHPGEVKTAMWAEINKAAEEPGSSAERHRKWARWVAETGGDDPAKAADLIARLVSDKAASINGRFLWFRDGLKSPVPSWGEFIPDEAWRDQ